MQYLTALKENRTADAMYYKAEILARFPDSNEAYIVSQPDYFDRLRRMAVEQDSLYEQTYRAYTTNQFDAVKTNAKYAEVNYPLTPLMPRFLFLNAIAVAKTDGQEAFVASLRDMVTRYPDSELSAMGKDMLALMGQGAESQQDSSTSSLRSRRNVVENSVQPIDTTIQFNPERAMPAMVLMVIPQNEKLLNDLLYEVALFNFTQFMIKDFDLKQRPMFTSEQSALQITGFISLDEAEWYKGLLDNNTDLNSKLQALGVQIICITEANNELLGNPFSVVDYLLFLKESN
jgi:hypothetical protein